MRPIRPVSCERARERLGQSRAHRSCVEVRLHYIRYQRATAHPLIPTEGLADLYESVSEVSEVERQVDVHDDSKMS